MILGGPHGGGSFSSQRNPFRVERKSFQSKVKPQGEPLIPEGNLDFSDFTFTSSISYVSNQINLNCYMVREVTGMKITYVIVRTTNIRSRFIFTVFLS